MATRTRIEPIETWVQLVVDEELSPKARAQHVADYARTRIGEVQAANQRVMGKVSPVKVFVDERLNAPLESVDPDRGRIVAEFDLALDVLRWIATRLRESSPVISGEYRNGHRLFADGTEIAAGADVPEVEEYAFTNLAPYARRLEVGKTKSGRAFVIQVEPRIYERVAREARGRFGNIAEIGYTFRAIVNGAQINAAKMPVALKRPRTAKGRFAAAGGRREHNRPEIRYPTVTVRLR